MQTCLITCGLDILAKGSQVLHKFVQLFHFLLHSIADEVKFDVTAWADVCVCVFMKYADMRSDFCCPYSSIHLSINDKNDFRSGR